jgi:hypothetical protein
MDPAVDVKSYVFYAQNAMDARARLWDKKEKFSGKPAVFFYFDGLE